jgi:hypothetical protein
LQNFPAIGVHQQQRFGARGVHRRQGEGRKKNDRTQ